MCVGLFVRARTDIHIHTPYTYSETHTYTHIHTAKLLDARTHAHTQPYTDRV